MKLKVGSFFNELALLHLCTTDIFSSLAKFQRTHVSPKHLCFIINNLSCQSCFAKNGKNSVADNMKIVSQRGLSCKCTPWIQLYMYSVKYLNAMCSTHHA